MIKTTDKKPHPKKAAIPAVPPAPEIQLSSLPKLTQAIEENMRALAEVMEDEIKFLGAQDLKNLFALREKKAKLLRDYQAHIMAYTRKPELLQATPPETRSKLRETSETLAVVAEKNATGLRAAISATQSLLDLVISAARENTPKNECYTDPRKTGAKANAYSPVTVPVAVNRTA